MTTASSYQKSSWNNFQHIQNELKSFYQIRDIAMQAVVDSYAQDWGHNKKWLMDLIQEIPSAELSKEFTGSDARPKNFFFDMKNNEKSFIVNFMRFPRCVQSLKPFLKKNENYSNLVHAELRKLGREFGRSIEITNLDGWFALSIGGLKRIPKK